MRHVAVVRVDIELVSTGCVACPVVVVDEARTGVIVHVAHFCTLILILPAYCVAAFALQ